jgi:hypothetical protein
MKPSFERTVLAALLLQAAIYPACAAGLTGTWSGVYLCGHGPTHADIAVAEYGGGRISALMHFYADPSNPGVPEGCFALRGVEDPSGSFHLHPTQWILRPMGYAMAGLEGQIDVQKGSIDGIVDMPSCGGFHGTRIAAVPITLPACGGATP